MHLYFVKYCGIFIVEHLFINILLLYLFQSLTKARRRLWKAVHTKVPAMLLSYSPFRGLAAQVISAVRGTCVTALRASHWVSSSKFFLEFSSFFSTELHRWSSSLETPADKKKKRFIILSKVSNEDFSYFCHFSVYGGDLYRNLDKSSLHLCLDGSKEDWTETGVIIRVN